MNRPRRCGFVARPEYEAIFDAVHSPLNALDHQDVFCYQVKTITSGKVRECEIFPVFNTRRLTNMAYEAHREKETSEAQRKVNARNARKALTRKINCNFDESDMAIHLTYKGEPPELKQAQQNVINYLRRIRYYREKNHLPELKYIYITEHNDGKNNEPTKRMHHHVILSGMDRDIAEKLWMHGRANSKRLQPDDYEYEAIARYIAKDPKGKKRWCGSRNLASPKITTSRCKLSRRQAMRLAEDSQTQAPAIFEKLNPAYRFLNCEVKTSSFVPGAYIYAKLRVEEQPNASTHRKRSSGRSPSHTPNHSSAGQYAMCDPSRL